MDKEKPHVKQARLMRSFIIATPKEIKIATEATTPFLIMVKYAHDDKGLHFPDRLTLIQLDEYLLQIENTTDFDEIRNLPAKEKMLENIIVYIQTQSPETDGL